MSRKAPYWPTIEAVDLNGITAVDMLEIVFFLYAEACADPSCIVNAFEEFINGIGRDQSRFYIDAEGDILPLPANAMAALNEQIVKPIIAKKHAGFFLVDGDEPAYRYYAYYLYDQLDPGERPQDERIPIWFRVPQKVLAEAGPNVIISFALWLTEILPYSYGYVSPVLTCEGSFRTALPYIQRYPGLDIAKAGSVAMDIGDRPLGAYWMNLFGPHLSQKLGGIETLRSALPEQVRVSSSGQGGSCVILGDVPDIGDVNRQNNLPLYHQLAAVLRPHMQVPEVAYFTDKEGMADREGQAAWHNRFFDD